MAKIPAVLIIDQNADRRFQIRQIIQQSQFNVCGEVGYGTAAISLAMEVKPDLIMCGSDDLPARSAQTVESLINALPETPVVVYSPTPDIEIARRAMLAGARDFLAMPLKAEQVRDCIVGALESEERRRMRLSGRAGMGLQGTVITVFGPKGGIGKTTIVTNLGIALVQAGESVVCIDSDTGFGDVAGMLDLQPERTVVELSRRIEEVSRETLPRHLTAHSSGLIVLAAPAQPLDWRNVDPDRFRKVVEMLARSFDVVLIDTGGILDEVGLAALEASSLVIWISTPEYASIKDSLSAMNALRGISYPMERIRLLINQVSQDGDVGLGAIRETLEHEIFWHIPFDRSLQRGVQLGQPTVLKEPHSQIARNFANLARLISGRSNAKRRSPGLLQRLGLDRKPRGGEPAVAAGLTGEEI